MNLLIHQKDLLLFNTNLFQATAESIHIFNVGAPDPLMIRGQCLYNSVWNQWYQGDISGYGDPGANAFLIQMSSGNIKSGTFSIFGFNEG